jgi:hypothetical protein
VRTLRHDFPGTPPINIRRHILRDADSAAQYQRAPVLTLFNNGECVRSDNASFDIKQEVLGRTNRLLSFHYKFRIRLSTHRIENTASNSSILACVFVAADSVYRAVAYQCPSLR